MAKINQKITNSFPLDINNDVGSNKQRHVSIMVKKMGVMSDIDKLIGTIEKASFDTAGAVSIGEAAGAAGKTFVEQAAAAIKSRNNGRKFQSDTIWGCALQLPNELSENQSHEWSAVESLVGGALGSITNASILGVSIHKALGEIASKSGNRKSLVNPGYFQDYRGTQPRNFTFTWDFMPNSKEEAQEITEILMKLKKYSLPTTYGVGLGLLSPYLFDIRIGNDTINTLITMNDVVCTNMSISYSADNALQMFGDGMPKYMTLQMSFAERTTVTADDYPKDKK